MAEEMKKLPEKKTPLALMKAISDGLTGFMAYEARCGMAQAYNEYFLYGPIVRISNHREWRIESEWPHAKGNFNQVSRKGDHERIDFLFRAKSKDSDAADLWVALEVKWAGDKVSRLNVAKDVQKLQSAAANFDGKNLKSFLLIVGRHSIDKSGKPILQAKLTGLPDRQIVKYTSFFCTETAVKYGVTLYAIT